MPFTKSTVAINNISNLANKPLESAPTLKQKFDQYGIDDKVRFNSLIDELEATTGTSGAENIGSKTITGITGNTIWAQLQSLYNSLAGVVLGQIPDGSLTYGKQSTSAKSIIENQSFKNKIINGNFEVNQRVVSGTVILAAGEYGHDRWKAGSSGCTYTFSTAGNITTITISTGSLIQVIEGLNLQSGSHVLSWTGTAQGKIGTGSFSSSGVTGIITGGTNTSIEFNLGTLTKVQFEIGSASTLFEQRPFGVESSLCKRYYEKIDVSENYSITVGQAVSATQCTMCFYNSVEMRVNPVVSIFNLGAINVLGNATNLLSAIVLNRPTTKYTQLVCTTSGLSAGNATSICGITPGNGYVKFDAEL